MALLNLIDEKIKNGNNNHSAVFSVTCHKLKFEFACLQCIISVCFIEYCTPLVAKACTPEGAGY